MLAIPQRDWRLWRPSRPLRRLASGLLLMADHLKYTGAHLTYKTVGGTSHLAYCGGGTLGNPCTNCTTGTTHSSYQFTTGAAWFSDLVCTCSSANSQTYVLTQNPDNCVFTLSTTAGACDLEISATIKPGGTVGMTFSQIILGVVNSSTFTWSLSPGLPTDCTSVLYTFTSETFFTAVQCGITTPGNLTLIGV
jgi:hypothetical protein